MCLRIIHNILPILIILPGILLAQEAGQLLGRAKQLQMTDPDSSSWYAMQAYRIALREDRDSTAYAARFILGKNEQLRGDKEEAISIFKRLIADAGADSFHDVVIDAYGRIGGLYTETGNFDSSLVYLLQFDKLVDQYWQRDNNDAKLLLGELYRAMGDMATSDKYKLEAIERSRRSGIRMEQMLALYYYLMDHREEMYTEDFQEYLEEYMSLVKQGRSDGSTSHLAMILGDMPEEEQVTSLKNAISKNANKAHLTSQLVFHEELVRLLVKKRAYGEALKYAENGFELARQGKDKPYQADFHELLFQCYEGLKQYSDAILHLQAHHALTDSLRESRLQRNIDEINLKYKSAQKEKQLAEQQYALGQVKMERNFLVGGLAMLLWFGGFLVVYFWNRNRVNKKLALQESQISLQRIRELEQEKNLLAMTSMIEGQEAERKRIAQDLHDGLGGLLSNVKAQLHAIEMRVDALANMDVYGKASQMVDQASKEVRRIAYNMMPTSLSRLGLKAAIEDLTADIASHHELHVETQLLDLDTRFDETQEIMLYRIIQELCHNVIKHADASEMIIQTNRLDDKLILVVEDNGKGFDPVAANSYKGVGMSSLESRVRYLGGDLDISSGHGGTCVTVTVPLLQELTSDK